MRAAALSDARTRMCARKQSAEPVTPLDLYKHAFTSYFPPQPKKSDAVRPLPAAAAAYALRTRFAPLRAGVCTGFAG